jgi:antitoxin component YwqK of YwqJK toxin-antitoxin module
MKHILTTMVLMTFLFSGLTHGEIFAELVKRDGLYYKNFTNVPFTGNITGKMQGEIRNGKQVGPWIAYHPNGQLLYQGTFKNGKMVGRWVIYYDDGQLMDIKNYDKYGNPVGAWVHHFPDGTLWSKGTWKDGEFVLD